MLGGDKLETTHESVNLKQSRTVFLLQIVLGRSLQWMYVGIFAMHMF